MATSDPMEEHLLGKPAGMPRSTLSRAGSTLPATAWSRPRRLGLMERMGLWHPLRWTGTEAKYDIAETNKEL